MNQENKDRLLRLLQQHKALGISDQIDFDKFYLYSIISNSVSLVDGDYGTVIDQSELDNLTIEPSFAEKMVDILDFVPIKTKSPQKPLSLTSVSIQPEDRICQLSNLINRVSIILTIVCK